MRTGAMAERHQPGCSRRRDEPHGRDRQRHDHGSGVVRTGQARASQTAARSTARPRSSNGRYFCAGDSFIRNFRSARRAAAGRTEQHHEHQHIHRMPRRRRARSGCDARTTPTSSAAITTPQKLPRPPIHHDHEGDGDDVGAHRGCDDRRRRGPRKCGHADAEHDDGGQIRLQPDAEAATISGRWMPARTTRPKEVLCSSSQTRPARLRPRPGSGGVTGKQEVACQHRPAKRRRDRCRQGRRAPDDADRLLGDHRKTNVTSRLISGPPCRSGAGCSVRTGCRAGQPDHGDNTTARSEPRYLVISTGGVGAERERTRHAPD